MEEKKKVKQGFFKKAFNKFKEHSFKKYKNLAIIYLLDMAIDFLEDLKDDLKSNTEPITRYKRVAIQEVEEVTDATA